mmetsp:Transcript_53632/g.100645  ORF Transcript_53632/g.100645 Transcript_53632/m.100645 type:complete len:1298 (+) Transcript_53632:53-3946(+)
MFHIKRHPWMARSTACVFFYLLSFTIIFLDYAFASQECESATGKGLDAHNECFEEDVSRDGNALSLLQFRAVGDASQPQKTAVLKDLGQGCCVGARDESAGKLWAGPLPTMADCHVKCLGFQNCGAFEYGWRKGNTQWCFLWDEQQPCTSLAAEPTSCGMGGGDNGVHVYKMVRKLADNLEVMTNDSMVEPQPKLQDSGKNLNEGGDAPSLFVGAFSRRTGFERRAAFRKGWSQVWSSVIGKFVLCDTPHGKESDNLAANLKNESERYGDILFVECQEGYSSLTSKTKAILEEFHRSYGNQSIFFKTDDDTFVAWNRLRNFLSHTWSPLMYAGAHRAVETDIVIRDPCCFWHEDYDIYPNASFPATFEGGTGYLLGADLVRDIVTNSLHPAQPLLNNEDRAVALWVEEARKRGRVVEYLHIPGLSGYSAQDWRQRCLVLDVPAGHQEDFLLHEDHTGQWKDKDYILLHKLSPSSMSCLTDIDAMGMEQLRIDDCFDDEKPLSSMDSQGNAVAKEREKVVDLRKSSGMQAGSSGCECNLCGESSQQWLIILSPSGRTGSSSIVTMLNAIPGFHIAGDHHGIIDNMYSIYRKLSKQFEANLRPYQYHQPISEHKVLCSLQSTIRAALAPPRDHHMVLGFKEINFYTNSQLKFLEKLFPCARFIVSSRQDFQQQAASQKLAFKSREAQSQDLARKTFELEAWSQTFSSRRAFRMRLEDFSLHGFNMLLRWLGVAGCQFLTVAHEYDSGGFSKDASQVSVNGTCAVYGDKAFEATMGSQVLYSQIPEKNIIMCACTHCGSTSMHNFVNQSLFRRAWNHTDQPGMQGVSSHWRNRLEHISAASALPRIGDPQVFSLALLRDPRERLISAWKKTVACDSACWNTGVADRSQIVSELLALAGKNHRGACLPFHGFVEALYQIHSQGKASALSHHFLPQHLGCFKDVPIEKWSQVTKVSDAAAATNLGKHLGNTGASRFPHDNMSPERCSEGVSGLGIRRLLDLVTAAEYRALGIKPEREDDVAWKRWISSSTPQASRSISLSDNSPKTLWLPDSWKLAWADEFDSDSLNTSSWSANLKTSKGNMAGAVGAHVLKTGDSDGYAGYIKEDNVLLGNGTLRLRVQKELTTSLDPPASFEYSSGWVHTSLKMSFFYGYVEARLRFPANPKAWPAFWASSDPWPPEFDIAEYFAVPRADGKFGLGQHVITGDVVPRHRVSWREDFDVTVWHRYGLLWQPGQVEYYIDGKWSQSFPEPGLINPMFLVLNNDVRLGVDEHVNDIFPTYAEIDYVRLYQDQNDPKHKLYFAP